MNENIKIICGESGNFQELEEIGNNPNYVFQKDPNFEVMTLFNENGQIINVNSWLECANYVQGGWISDKIDLINGERILFLTGCLFIFFYYIKKFIVNNKRLL